MNAGAPRRRSYRAAGALGAVLATVLVTGVPAGIVFADAAGPTNFRSEVVAVSPPTDTITAEIIGGDSFFQLTVTPGTEVLVNGYQQEPYLRFGADGIVEENQRAPTTYLNASRFGGDVPAGADPTLPPDWQPVGTGGRYAWHDHRAHWMSQDPPTTATPGTLIQTSDIAMNVAGAPVAVTVAVTWLPAPSRLPLAVGAAVGGALLILALVTRRRLAWPLLVVALGAVGIGWWQFSSLPPETGPLLVWWLLPAVAAASVLVALVIGARLVSYALVLLAAFELAVWVFVRRDGAFRALIPTDAPFWLDRAVMAATGVVAVVAAIGAAAAMYRLPVGDD